MTDVPMLRFSLADLLKELRSVTTLASGFLTATGAQRLRRTEQALAALATRPRAELTWEVPLDEPIETRPSPGEYERRARSVQKGAEVHGALSFSWGLLTGPNPVKELYLTGNATTRLRLFDIHEGVTRELSMWRMEIGAHDSPGCCFHAQILGRDEHPPFPESLPVPRIPIFPPTPMSCLEFLLSELFQSRWQARVERGSASADMWRGIQSRRLTSFLNWQLREIKQATGSPLVRLKAFPSPEVLLG